MSKRKLYSRVIGGLGNQLFIYAFAKAYSIRNNITLYFDLKSGYKKDEFGREPLLKKFFENIEEASYFDILVFFFTKKFPFLSKLIFKAVLVYETNPKEFVDIFSQDNTKFKKIFTQGNFQSYDYFSDFEIQIKSGINFFFSKTDLIYQLANTINATNSVCVHVRRIDYVYKLDLEYYLQAFREMERHISNPVFFIFSDDIKWCKSNFPSEYPINFITHDVSEEIADLWLMTLCKNFIIANSSFSWWGAWLSSNETKCVIAPDAMQLGVIGKIYPPTWKTL